MNKTWLIKDLQSNFYLQSKVIFLIDKLCEQLKFKNILIGYDFRTYSQRIAETLVKGLNKKYNAFLSGEPSNASLLSHITKKQISDIAVFITGDYNDWNSYGLKIKLNNGRHFTEREIKKAKQIMKEFHPSTYYIDYSLEAEKFYVEKTYTRYIYDLFPNKNLNYNVAYNTLHYSGSALNMKVLQEQGCKVHSFNYTNNPSVSGNPKNPNSIKELDHFIEITNADLGIILTDGEQMIIKTKDKLYTTEEIALMYIEILKDKFSKIVFSIDYPKIKRLATKNNIKHEIRNKNPYKFYKRRTLIISNDSIIDTHFADSMDANIVLLTILHYLKLHNLSIDDFYNSIEKSLKVKQMIIS